MKQLWSWLKGAFSFIKHNADNVAIAATQAVKFMLTAGLLQPIADVIDSELHMTLGEDIVQFLQKNINTILAEELALQGLPENPTSDDIKSFAESAVKSFLSKTDFQKGEFATSFAAKLYGKIQTDLNGKSEVTFAELVGDVESAFQEAKDEIQSQ